MSTVIQSLIIIITTNIIHPHNYNKILVLFKSYFLKFNIEKEKVETESTLATISLRALVTTKEAGVIIGKGGKNVSEIRDRSGAKVTISEMVQGAYERILTVTGPLDTVAKVCQNFYNRTNKSYANINCT